MDTNISDADLARSDIGLSPPLGLPGEEGGTEPSHHFQEHGSADAAGHARSPIGLLGEGPGGTEPPDHTQSHGSIGTAPGARLPTSSHKSRRGFLLGGVAFALLLGAGAAGYVYRQPLRDMAISKGLIAAAPNPIGHLSSVTGPVLSATNGPAPAKPTVSISNASGVREAGLPAGKPGTVAPRQQPVVPVASSSTSKSTQASEITGLKTEQPLVAPPVTASVSNAPEVIPPVTVVSSAPEVNAAASKPILVANTPLAADISIPWRVPQLVVTPAPAPMVTTPPEQHPPATPNASAPAASVDPTVTAAAVQAAPLSTTQQVQLLDLVKNLGAQLRDTRTEVTQLRTTVVQLSGTVETKINDFDGRLSMAEATTILQSSARAGAPIATPVAPVMPAAPAARPVPAVVPSARLTNRASFAPDSPVAPLTQAGERHSPKDYTIRGASPGLAVVAAVNPAPGSPSVFELAVGDSVPGLGHVKRVYQRGTSWAVDTDGGTIQ